MTVEELKALFNKHDEEYIEWDSVKVRRSAAPDVHAFLLLEELCPFKAGHPDMVQGARHDEITLRPEAEELAAVVTEEQVIELLRCGVRLEKGYLCMFV